MTPDIPMSQGNRLPILRRPLRLRGEPVDLTGASVEFRFRPQSGGASRGGSCTVFDADEAVVEYAWQSGDTDIPGVFDANFTATYVDGREITFPNLGYLRMVVTAKIAALVAP